MWNKTGKRAEGGREEGGKTKELCKFKSAAHLYTNKLY